MDEEQRTTELEGLNKRLSEPLFFEEYKRKYDAYRPSILPRILGEILVECGNIVYGKSPSCLKFRAVEVIARVPYQSWESAAYTLLTIYYANEKKAIELSNITTFARIAQDNETMHVVVISQLAKESGHSGVLRYTLIPMFFAFIYFWASYILYLIKPRYSYELNYLFENHAFLQYDLFLELNRDVLKSKQIKSDFLRWYGRIPQNQYEFFRSVRNDELIHRNRSIEQIRSL